MVAVHVFHHVWRWGYIRVIWKLEPRDMWIGLYWKRYPKAIDLYLCVLPMLPLNVYLQWY